MLKPFVVFEIADAPHPSPPEAEKKWMKRLGRGALI